MTLEQRQKQAWAFRTVRRSVKRSRVLSFEEKLTFERWLAEREYALLFPHVAYPRKKEPCSLP